MGFLGDIDHAADDAGEDVSSAADDAADGVMETPVGDAIDAQARSISQQAEGEGGADESPGEVAADAAEDSMDAIGDDF